MWPAVCFEHDADSYLGIDRDNFDPPDVVICYDAGIDQSSCGKELEARADCMTIFLVELVYLQF